MFTDEKISIHALAELVIGKRNKSAIRYGSALQLYVNYMDTSPLSKTSRQALEVLEMYKIRYFLTVKYFMKYFRNISVFNEIFQNATSLCSTCFFLPQGATAHI